MKKLFSLLIATIIIITGLTAQQVIAQQMIPDRNMHRQQMKKEFEQRLNLTEKQKQKAKEIHQEGRRAIEPVMIQIEVKRQEINTVKLSKISDKAQQEKIDRLNNEIKELETQAREIRKKNSQDFEKILNKKQKAELDKMKAEGRARYEQYHKPRPPFQGLGTPNFLLRPLLPPPAHHHNW